MGRLEGKVVFLTGAGAGIAKATAKMCAREGAGVAICELNREAGERAEREIHEAGGNALFVQADVTQDENVRDAIAATVKHFGKLNVLFNCAGGSSQDDRPVHEMDLDVWHKTVALNLLHPFLTCRHGIPHMIKAGGGSIVNVTSHLGLVGSLKPAYAATKGGIISFTKTLAAQYVQYPSARSHVTKTRILSKSRVPRRASARCSRSCIRFRRASPKTSRPSRYSSPPMNHAC